MALLATVLGFAGLLIGRLGPWSPLLDAANIAQPLWMMLALGGLLGLAAHGARAPLLAGAGLLLLAVWLASLVPAAARRADCPPERRLVVVQFNLFQANRTPDAAADWIRAQGADVLLLQEAKGSAGGIVQALTADFPFRQGCSLRGFCSTLIMSRTAPARALALARGDPENRQALSAAAMQFADSLGRYTLVSVHLSHPLPVRRQPAELAELGRVLAQLGAAPIVVGGDFNATVTMQAVHRLAASAGLRLASAPGPSWPAQSRWPPLLAIDQLLVGGGLAVVKSQRGPAMGSDHRPQRVILCRDG